eukprot:TRINITY_DN19145_c0_g1_i1.p1 TRINITY_DN19145_c0_g1~~TRINITY_DN19145_c0_g1_i1.p1  ORF type:complete len:1550 (-),score=253.58 TRINITY_DN19145_c0_g1_i1:616-4587(-)
MVQAGRTVITLNGIILNPDKVDIFSLLEMVHEELSFADRLSKLNLPSSAIRQLAKVSPKDDDSNVRLDFRTNLDVLHYMNNIESDLMYRGWRSSLQELLMPVFPGQMRSIKKNLYHAVYALDPSSSAGLKSVEEISYFLRNMVPIRFALLLVSPKRVDEARQASSSGETAVARKWDGNDVAELVVRFYHWVRRTAGTSQAFEFLEAVADEASSSLGMFSGMGFGFDEEIEREDLTKEKVEKTFLEFNGNPGAHALEAIKGPTSPEAAASVLAAEYLVKLGLGSSYPVVLFNGKVLPWEQSIVIQALNEETRELQQKVYYQQITQHTDVLDFLLKAGSVKRYNPQILGTDGSEIEYVGLATVLQGDTDILPKLHYLHKPGTEDVTKVLSFWLLLDLSSRKGLELIAQAAQYLDSASGSASRIAVLHRLPSALPSSPDDRARPGYLLLPRIVLSFTNVATRRSKLVPFLSDFLARPELASFVDAPGGVLADDVAEELVQLALTSATEAGLKVDGLASEWTGKEGIERAVERLTKEATLLANQVSEGNAIICNGRKLVPNGPFTVEDFALIESVEKKKGEAVGAVVEAIDWESLKGIEVDDLTSEFISTILMASSSEVWARKRKGDVAAFGPLFSKVDESILLARGGTDDGDALLLVEGLLDPLSSAAQSLAPLLLLLQDWFKVATKIIMNPRLSLAEVPLKNFYRYAQPPMVKDLADEGGSAGVTFLNLPGSRTLTLNLKVAEPWLVEPLLAVYDLDNLVLDKVAERAVHAVFELEALMLTGHCYEGDEPPQGLQLVLGTPQNPHMVDTIVMANLGYFQLKAAPGVWTLQLAPGRSSDLYTIAGPGEGTNDGATNQSVVVGDLKGQTVRLDVVKRIGKEREKVLESPDSEEQNERKASKSPSARSWSSAFNVFGGGGGVWGDEEEEDDDKVIKDKVQPSLPVAPPSTDGDGDEVLDSDPTPFLPPGVVGHHNPKRRRGETINIFSIASGHLYERFTKIMILSVLNNTDRPVKFWFIKNYLSPGFKDVIPVMAQEYGFEAELVTYKWPSWLHKQTEKQRLIWAYKILFLDVIFPLSTKKVIFVDADQIVRADIGELYDMDLEGRALAYTPMCDNNVDMEGYRFWKQGFWRDHLQGRAYHISALYVVDLVRFRQQAAGDQLRVFYENLSKDPNSLANLDQDLPNYAQHTVPIFSLPQHWLWCESWCGNATKSAAKTIDLCNNPMTKEPKLEGARRIVAEWPALDEEQRLFTERVEAGAFDPLVETRSSLTASPSSSQTEEPLDLTTSHEEVGLGGGLSDLEREEAEEARRDGREESTGDGDASKDEL